MADLNRQQVKIENKICSGNPDSRKQSLKNDFKSGDPPSRVLIVSPAQVDRAMSRYVTTDEKVHEGDDKSLPIKTGPTIKQRIDKRADAKAIDTENVTDEDNLYSDASSDVGIIIRDLHKPTVQVRRNQSILEGQKKLSRQERKIVKGRTNTLETFSKRQKRRTARGEIPAEEEYIGGSAIIDWYASYFWEVLFDIMNID